MSSEDFRIVHLVDDDDAIRRSVSFALKTSGFQVRVYEDGDGILKVAPDLEAGCILLDIRMPGMDGLEVQEALKSKGVTLPVVIMTGHGDVSLAVRAMKAGAVDFIEKPFQKAVLLSAIEHGTARLQQSASSLREANNASVKLQLLSARERRCSRWACKGTSEQVDRLRSRHQSAHRGNSSREPHGQAWREEPFGSASRCLCGRRQSFRYVTLRMEQPFDERHPEPSQKLAMELVE